MSNTPDWDAVRVAYADSRISLQDIYATHGVNFRQLYDRRIAEGWPPRVIKYPRKPRVKSDPPAVPPVTDGSTPQQSAPPLVPLKLSAAQRRDFIQRLNSTIEADLVVLERRLAEKRAVQRTPGEAENDSRTIGLILKNIEQLSEFAKPATSGGHLHGAAARAHALAVTELADEADRRRRQLQERLARVVEATADAPPSSA